MIVKIFWTTNLYYVSEQTAKNYHRCSDQLMYKT